MNLEQAIRAMLDAGTLTDSRADYYRAGRCPSRRDSARCALIVGHEGAHTSLVESDAPWAWHDVDDTEATKAAGENQ